MVKARTVRQQAIIDAARKVIFSKGIESLTVREIAKELKITNAALYRHFKSKKEILSLLIDDIEENLLEAVQKAAAGNEGPLQKLEAIFLAHLSYSEQVKGTSFAVINQVAALKDKNLQRKTFQLLNGYLKTIQDILSEGAAQGVWKKDIDPKAASIVFWGMLQSAVTLWNLSGHKMSLRKPEFVKAFSIFKNWASS